MADEDKLFCAVPIRKLMLSEVMVAVQLKLLFRTAVLVSPLVKDVVASVHDRALLSDTVTGTSWLATAVPLMLAETLIFPLPSAFADTVQV